MSTNRPPGRRYHLRRLLGEGAFGSVYLAEQESEGGFRRLVALKVLNQQVAKRSEAERRMRDEARVLGQLQHRNIVAVLDLVRLSSRWAIVMDHVPGVDLEGLVHEAGPVPPAAAFAIGVGVARALAAAHTAVDNDGQPLHVVHRDIKPSNVRLTADGDVKVLDFGVARFSLDARESETRGGGWIGTERYMSPERILGQGDTPAGDVYATAATVFELLVGEPLGRTPALPNHHATMVGEALERLAIHRPDDAPPAWTDAVCALEQALAANPSQRPAAAELAEAWASCVASLPGETLAAFAGRVVPGIETSRDLGSQLATGVLEEGSRDEQTVLGTGSLGGGSTDGGGRPWFLAAGVFASFVGGVGVVALVAAALIGAGVLPVPRRATEPEVAPASVAQPEPAPAIAPEPVEDVEPKTASVVEPPAVATPPSPEPAPAPVPSAVPQPAPRGPEVAKALFTLENASGIWVSCGGVTTRGTASARIGAFAAGPCEVRANYLGVDYRAVVEVVAPRTVQCSIRGEEMTCS